MKRYGIAAILAVCALLASCARMQNRLTVTNASGVAALKVVVTVCGEAYDLGDIPAGGSKTRRFSVNQDSGFQVTALLADGTTLTTQFGYVTAGAGAYGNHADIEITKTRQIIGKQN